MSTTSAHHLTESLKEDLRLLAEHVRDEGLRLALAALFAHPLCPQEVKEAFREGEEDGA